MNIPKFLLCENFEEDDFDYILHTQTPRFLARVDGVNIGIVMEIDHFIPNELQLARIMQELGEWYVQYMNRH